MAARRANVAVRAMLSTGVIGVEGRSGLFQLAGLIVIVLRSASFTVALCARTRARPSRALTRVTTRTLVHSISRAARAAGSDATGLLTVCNASLCCVVFPHCVRFAIRELDRMASGTAIRQFLRNGCP